MFSGTMNATLLCALLSLVSQGATAFTPDPVNRWQTAAPKCEDRLTNCPLYGMSACSGTGIYGHAWAWADCRKYCGLCANTGTTHSTPHNTSSACADVRTDCKALGPFYCKTPYLEFGRKYCKKSCNLCGASHVCLYGGHAYQEGETFRSIDGCNICECNQHKVDCTARSCI